MGWNGSGGAATSHEASGARRQARGRGPSPVRGVIAGLLVIVLAAVAYFAFFSCSGKPRKAAGQKKPVTIREVTPAAAPRQAEPAPDGEARVEKPKEVDTWRGVKVDHRTARTNGTMVVETIYTVDGNSHVYYRDTTPQIFDNASDQILALATADGPGGSAPPLPSLGPKFENAFADSLKREIVIGEDDSDEVRSIKERVRQARQDLLDAMAEGMTMQQVLTRHRQMQEDNAAIRMEAVNGLKEYLEKGDSEGAQMYVDKMNPTLEQMGIMKIELPRSHEEIRAERLERSAARRARKEETK